MKTLLLYFTICIAFISCKKDDDPTQDPIDQLPLITQTGENTVGCLVDGEVLLPVQRGITPSLICFYQLVDGDYFFSLGFSDQSRDPLIGLNIFAINSQLSENTFELNTLDDGTTGLGAEYRIGGGTIDVFNTNKNATGELNITKLDEQNQIISGTFFFDAVNEDGDVVEIREGRFDMEYSN